MSADIVERLREGVPHFIDTGPGGDLHVRRYDTVAASHTMAEAAATIERLTRERDRYASDARERAAKLDAALADVERLQKSWRKLDDTANEWADRAHTAEARAEAVEAELAKAREAVAALAWLVRLKDNRPQDYEEQKPLAWAAARAALATDTKGEARCCSSMSPCSWQRHNGMDSVCPTCIAAALATDTEVK